MITLPNIDSKFNYKKASKHPTPAGHKLWANYLYTALNCYE